MADILILKRRLSVGTVDSFQGQERGISAITLTRSNPQGEVLVQHPFCNFPEH
jgi:superfamily I DNA and/or RNA helicase